MDTAIPPKESYPKESYQKKVYKVIKELTEEGAILTVVPRLFIKKLGNVTYAHYLSQILYWSDKGHCDEEGRNWFWKTEIEWLEETGFTIYSLRKARKTLEDLGILETKIKKAMGNPTVHFHVNEERLIEWMLEPPPEDPAPFDKNPQETDIKETDSIEETDIEEIDIEEIDSIEETDIEEIDIVENNLDVLENENIQSSEKNQFLTYITPKITTPNPFQNSASQNSVGCADSKFENQENPSSISDHESENPPSCGQEPVPKPDPPANNQNVNLEERFVTYQQWWGHVSDASNKVAALVAMQRTLYPGHDPPPFGYMGRVMKRIGWGQVCRYLWELNTKQISGDVLNYLQAVWRNNGKEVKSVAAQENKRPDGDYGDVVVYKGEEYPRGLWDSVMAGTGFV